MQLTEQDQKMFEALHDSTLGKNLCDYMERFMDEMCDIRNMENPTPDFLDAIKQLNNNLEANIIARIKLVNEKPEERKAGNDFE